jgi:hypothetical protein
MSANDLRPGVPSRFRRGRDLATVEALLGRIGSLASQRQELRAAGAPADALERNRVEIARAQWQLSYALVERHVAPRAQRSAA